MLDTNLMLLDETVITGAANTTPVVGAWVNFENVGGGVAPVPAGASAQVRPLSWLLVVHSPIDADLEGTEAFQFSIETSKDGAAVENTYSFESFLASEMPGIRRVTIQSAGPYFRYRLVPVAAFIADETITVSLGPTDGFDYDVLSS